MEEEKPCEHETCRHNVRKIESALVLEKETEVARTEKDDLLCANRWHVLSETSWVTKDKYLTEGIPGRKQRAETCDFRGVQRHKE